jgi:diguanylate cyclase (GGDEF)-like protein
VTFERGLLLRRPGLGLGVVLLLISVDALLWSFIGPTGTPAGPDRLAAALFAGLSVLCLVQRREGPRWILEAAAATAIVLLTSAMASRVTPQGVLSVGVALLMLLVAAATFVPMRRLVLGILTGLAALAIGVVVNTVEVGVLYLWVLATGIVVVPLMVSALMAELRALVDVAAVAAVHDPLTGALNRRGLVDAADRVRAVAERSGTPTALVAVDLDGFKSVNDTRGHAAGDEELVALVQAWSTMLRAGDVLARSGGDEFLLVLPNTDANAALGVVERLRAAHPSPWSCGVVDWDQDEDLDSAMARADALLYEEKAGRRPTIDLRGATADARPPDAQK